MQAYIIFSFWQNVFAAGRTTVWDTCCRISMQFKLLTALELAENSTIARAECPCMKRNNVVKFSVDAATRFRYTVSKFFSPPTAFFRGTSIKSWKISKRCWPTNTRLVAWKTWRTISRERSRQTSPPSCLTCAIACTPCCVRKTAGAFTLRWRLLLRRSNRGTPLSSWTVLYVRWQRYRHNPRHHSQTSSRVKLTKTKTCGLWS